MNITQVDGEVSSTFFLDGECPLTNKKIPDKNRDELYAQLMINETDREIH